MKSLGARWTGQVHVKGVRYKRENPYAHVECSSISSMGERKDEVLVWDLRNDRTSMTDSGYTGRKWTD